MPENKAITDLKNTVKKLFTGFCSACHKECAVITKDEAKAKLTGCTTKSAKQKARRSQQAVAERIRKAFNLAAEDVESVSMGLSGRDIKLSEKAREAWPFHAIEVTASPNVSLMSKFSQAQRHGEKQLQGKVEGNGRPLLVFKRNGTELYALCLFDDLVDSFCEQKTVTDSLEKAS